MGLACWPRRRAIAFTDNGAPRTTKRFPHTLLAIFSARSEKQRLADLRPPRSRHLHVERQFEVLVVDEVAMSQQLRRHRRHHLLVLARISLAERRRNLAYLVGQRLDQRR